MIDAVPKQLLIGGEWRDASGGGDARGRGPRRPGETLCEIADATPEDAKAALDAAGRRAGRVGGHAAERARRDPLPRLRGAQRARRRAGAC